MTATTVIGRDSPADEGRSSPLVPLMMALWLTLMVPASAVPLRGLVVSGEYFSTVESNLLRDLGCQAVRWGFHQKDGSIDYDVYDRTVSLLETDGVEVLAIIGIESVSWSDPGEWATAEFRSRFAARAAEIASRYAGRISAYEIWSEENLAGVRIEPDAYGALLTEAYQAIEAADPAALVVLGGIGFASPDTANYLRGVYLSPAVQAFHSANGHYPFDKVGSHPYTYDQPPSGSLAAELVAYVKSVMNEFGDTAKTVWMTEIGWNTSPTAGAMGPDEAANELAQAGYYTDTIDITSTLVDPAHPGNGPFVEAVHWYQISDGGEQKFGLRRTMGRPKPAYWAFRSYPLRDYDPPMPTPTPVPPLVGEDLLLNGDFESGTPGYEAVPEEWVPWESDPAHDNHYWYLDLHPERPGVELRMISYGRMDCGVYQTVEGLSGGQAYYLSGWVYTNAPDGGAFQAQVAITDGTGSELPSGLAWSFVAPFGMEGTEFRVGPYIATSPQATVWLRANNPIGTLYHADFDDIAFQPAVATAGAGLWFAY